MSSNSGAIIPLLLFRFQMSQHNDDRRDVGGACIQDLYVSRPT